jgi:hypothetical protein
MFQNQYNVSDISVENESTTDTTKNNKKSPIPSTSTSNKKKQTPKSSSSSSATNKKHTKRVNSNAFPPERKKEWTVEDIKALKNERDLAVIAFRIVEILRFVTPENPLTTSRLINDMRVDQTATDLIKKYEGRAKVYHDSRLSCPSRLSRLSPHGQFIILY